jgi:hypothetical protein
MEQVTPQQKPRLGITPLTALCLFVLVAGLIPGCGMQQRWTSYKDPAYNSSELKKGRCALGGLVLRNGATLDKFSGVGFTPEEFTPTVQANLWTPLFGEAFKKVSGQKPAVDWFHYSSRVPAETQEKILSLHASQSLVTPDLLQICHENLPGIPYLVLSRLESTKLDSRYRGYAAEHASGRLVTMTMDVYDLTLYRSVYTHSVEYYDNGPGGPSSDDFDRTRRIQLPDSTNSSVGIAGHIIKAPTLTHVMAKCLDSLLGPLNFPSMGIDDEVDRY